MPSDLAKSYGGYSTFRPQRNAEGDDESVENDCEEKEDSGDGKAARELLAKWFGRGSKE